jgi:glycosyltransferase involved in cell wall biosynthesis
MKINILSSSEVKGGASRAANRLHRGLTQFGVESSMTVRSKQTDDWRVLGPSLPLGKIYSDILSVFERIPAKMLKSTNDFMHSPAITSFLKARTINNLEADVINMHWICDGFLSVRTIGKIKKPMVWTLHDSWAFCGSEHHPNGLEDFRYRQGYTPSTRDPRESGFDLDAWTWNRKHRNWKHPHQIISPSNWLANAASNSLLMQEWPIKVIPNPLDTDTYKPVNKKFSREYLGLPQDKKLILFGALNYKSNTNKGFDLLKECLRVFTNTETYNRDEYAGVIFGSSKPQLHVGLNLDVHFMGHLVDDYSLAMLYNAVDVVIVPSRMENLPQTATEAQSCGTPVVAFNTCGIPDSVVHKKTGYLAQPYDPVELAKGIEWIFGDVDRYKQMSIDSRQRALDLWALEKVIPQYIETYHEVFELSKY